MGPVKRPPNDGRRVAETMPNDQSAHRFLSLLVGRSRCASALRLVVVIDHLHLEATEASDSRRHEDIHALLSFHFERRISKKKESALLVLRNSCARNSNSNSLFLLLLLLLLLFLVPYCVCAWRHSTR